MKVRFHLLMIIGLDVPGGFEIEEYKAINKFSSLLPMDVISQIFSTSINDEISSLLEVMEIIIGSKCNQRTYQPMKKLIQRLMITDLISFNTLHRKTLPWLIKKSEKV